jgi:hypothetical protein
MPRRDPVARAEYMREYSKRPVVAAHRIRTAMRMKKDPRPASHHKTVSEHAKQAAEQLRGLVSQTEGASADAEPPQPEEHHGG